MNYRHGFHAGNFADVVKHAVLACALVALTRKETPLRYIETHAGAGRYDLSGTIAERSAEWREGIARLLRAPRPGSAESQLRPYIDAVGECDAQGRPLSYPGSPALAQKLLRRQDVIALCERHPEELILLQRNLGRDARLRIAGADGYVALNAYVPPRERRGLVFIDPPYEAADERERLVSALLKATAKWPRGCYFVWRPIKDRAEDDRFLADLKQCNRPNILNLETDIGRAPPPAPGLRRAGLVIFNPPFGLFDEARTLLSYLAPLLARGDGAGFTCDWLTAPA